jgi:hypothetical protein
MGEVITLHSSRHFAEQFEHGKLNLQVTFYR